MTDAEARGLSDEDLLEKCEEALWLENRRAEVQAAKIIQFLGEALKK